MTKLKLQLNDGPSLNRVILIALLLMAELILLKLMEILASNRMPTEIELCYLLVLGLVQLVTYISAWLRKEETSE